MPDHISPSLLSMLVFYVSVEGGWYSYDSRNPETVKNARILKEHGFLETNEHFQARYTGKIY